MSDVPTIVRILRYLREGTVHSTYSDIINNAVEGQASAGKALEKLTADGIIDKTGQRYSYHATTENDDFCNKLFALYERVVKRPQVEVMIRGLLCQPARRYLLRLDIFLEVFAKEGFSIEEVNRCLDEESASGYLKKVKLIFVVRESFPPPTYMPLYYRSYLREVNPVEQEELKEYCSKMDITFSEVEYVTGDYPAELAEPAVQYLDKEKGYIKDWLKEEAFHKWYGMRHGLRHVMRQTG
ncbi:hypothetical protein ACFLVB_01950 [Chloroflexota bacterium]